MDMLSNRRLQLLFSYQLLSCTGIFGFLFHSTCKTNTVPRGIKMSAKSSLLQIINNKQKDKILVCPEYLSPLEKKSRYYGLIEDTSLVSEEYGTKYKVIRDSYIDLTVKGEVDKPIWELSPQERIGQNLFQTPFISGIYERGYRQNFERSGFPGIEKEFSEVSELFLACNASTILDLSCGSGFMTRRFVKSGKYGQVFAADLSPTMLAETRRRFVEENLKVPTLIRCDVARLPFQDGSFEGIHAGAAMHCWPRLEQSLREIFRVLSPGGTLYTSTFLTTAVWNPQVSDRRSSTATGFRLFESPEELAGLLRAAGFDGATGDVVVRKEGQGCAIIKAVKGPLNPEKSSNLFAFFPSIAKSTASDVVDAVTSSSKRSDADCVADESVESAESAAEEVAARMQEPIASANNTSATAAVTETSFQPSGDDITVIALTSPSATDSADSGYSSQPIAVGGAADSTVGAENMDAGSDAASSADVNLSDSSKQPSTDQIDGKSGPSV